CLARLDKTRFICHQTEIDKEEAALFLSRHIAEAVKYAMSLIRGEDGLQRQIELANKIILLLKKELHSEQFEDDLVEKPGQILKAVFSRLDNHYTDLDDYLKEITPYTRLSHSELFTGGNLGLSLESELKKEILSSDRIDLLVSFIKWKGIVILKREFEEFIKRGGQLRVITTTYMGAGDAKAIDFLANLQNTQVKVSYNTHQERLHAKAYLFFRKSGFHTGYIGSSNFSRTALTDGLEWNVKITTKEVGHLIDKFQKTFESYWQNPEFEAYLSEKHQEKLRDALKEAKAPSYLSDAAAFFDLQPKHHQTMILETLHVERQLHQRYRNLIVAATGTGKTVISAFDFKNIRKTLPQAKLLYVAHRKEILMQALAMFRGILRNNNFGELWVDGFIPTQNEALFASVQTLNSQLAQIALSASYFDYIIIDEVHHIAAKSYRPVLDYFQPKILLGLTATPERMDGENILDDFCGRIAAEIRLPEALNSKLLCPFHYFGITDSVDLSQAAWRNGRYIPGELFNIYTANDLRVRDIILNLEKYLKDPHDVRALGFCVNIEHARY
ncbi:MAG TPA: DEAD/DEAH box helicase, partial [Candidatus Marinimicrobia bacterium]|nr:DEAD/DEAH box helicase [Candidatus Neomarinimicrobiota bacterium]